MQTPEIAPCGCNGKRFCTGIKMKKRFFFYWIDVVRAGQSVDQAIKDAALIFADAAYPALPICYDAIMTAQKTMKGIFVLFFIERGFFHMSYLFAENGLHDIIHCLDREEIDLLFYILGNFNKFVNIFMGNEDLLHMVP